MAAVATRAMARARDGPSGRRCQPASVHVFAIGNYKARGGGERLRLRGRRRGPKPKASLGGLLGGIFKGTDTGVHKASVRLNRFAHQLLGSLHVCPFRFPIEGHHNVPATGILS